MPAMPLAPNTEKLPTGPSPRRKMTNTARTTAQATKVFVFKLTNLSIIVMVYYSKNQTIFSLFP